jgi:magnesium transporter
MEHKKYNTDELKELQSRINKMDPVDLAEDFQDLSKTDTAIWMKLLKKDLLADTFALLPKDKKLEIIESLPDENIMTLIQELDEDELVDSLQELPANIVRKIMTYFVDEERRPVINRLLGYPEESVGSIMSINFISIKIDTDPKAALNKIIHSDLDANRLEQIWVTNESLVLIGFVYLADLLRNQDKTISTFLNSITASVKATDDQEVAAKLAQRYDIAEIPVTDSEGRLIGFIPAEWAIDILHEEYEEDLANIHGIQESDSEVMPYLEKSSLRMAKDRTIWLIICLITATFTGFIIHHYESLLSATVVLTAYIPMLMDSGGNAGTQASTTIIRALYAREVGFKDTFKVILKEAKVGLITGTALVLVNTVRMILLDTRDIAINLTVGITLLLTVILSKVIGGLMPLLGDRLNIDPTVMAGPLITTVVDTMVLLIYFEVASMLLGL